MKNINKNIEEIYKELNEENEDIKTTSEFLEENKEIIDFKRDDYIYLKTIKYKNKKEKKKKEYQVIININLGEIRIEIINNKIEYTYRHFLLSGEEIKEEYIIRRKIDKKNKIIEEHEIEKGDNKEIIIEGDNIIEKIICSLLYVKELEDKLNIIKETIKEYKE